MPAPLQTDHVREANRRAVYRALADDGPASRTDLARRTGLSVPTVAAILTDLAAAGAVRGAGRDPGTGGRPAQRFALAPNARHVLAVDLSGHRARAHRIDLLGRPGAGRLGPALGPGVDADLTAWLRTLVDDPSAPPVARVALAVPGVVDPLDGRVGLAPALGWDDEPVGAQLEAALGLPVRLENDVNALALAELHYGAGRGLENVVYVAIGSGIGAGIVVHGRLVRGAHAAAGEIGYAASPFHGPATAGTPAAGGPLERDLLRLAADFAPPDGQLDLGSAGRRAAFDHFAAGLRPVLHVLACALDPDRVVVAWPADPAGHLAAALGALGPGRTPVPVVAGALGADAAARGVGQLALEDVAADLCRSTPRLDLDPHLPGRPARERTAHA